MALVTAGLSSADDVIWTLFRSISPLILRAGHPLLGAPPWVLADSLGPLLQCVPRLQALGRENLLSQ